MFPSLESGFHMFSLGYRMLGDFLQRLEKDFVHFYFLPCSPVIAMKNVARLNCQNEMYAAAKAFVD